MVAVFAPGVGAEPSRSLPRPLVDVEWLAAHADEPDVVVLQVGKRETYDTRHVPGSIHVSRDDFAAGDESPLTLEMPTAPALAERLRDLGVTDRSTVVLCPSDGWVTPATRELLTLQSFGLGERTVLLDGGLEAWVDAGMPVTTVVPSPVRGDLSLTPNRAPIVTGKWLAEHLDDAHLTVIDARDRRFFTGESDAGGRISRPGHIRGAVSVPYSDVIDEHNRFLTLDRLARVFSDAGVRDGDHVVVYCHIGQQATLVLLAARLLGVPAMLYDGSYEEWSATPEWPVETDLPRSTAPPSGASP